MQQSNSWYLILFVLDKTFVTIIRDSGVPSSLNVISNKTGDGGPLLEPYPNWSWAKNQNCSGITSVYRVAVIKNCFHIGITSYKEIRRYMDVLWYEKLTLSFLECWSISPVEFVYSLFFDNIFLCIISSRRISLLYLFPKFILIVPHA